jgi:hypothetical protein
LKIAEQTESELKLTDSAGCFWLFGLFFIIMGGIFILGLLGLFTNLHELSNLEKAAVWIVSLGGVSAGIYLIYQNPGSGILFDKHKNTLKIARSGLFRNQNEEYSFNEIRNIVLSQSTDTDGDPVYRIEAELKTGKLVELSSLWIHNRNALEELAGKIKVFLEL